MQTMRAIAFFAAASSLLSLGACSPEPQETAALPGAPHRAEILASVDAFFIALGSADADAFEALHTANAMNVIAAPESGEGIRYRPVTQTVEHMRAGDFPVLRERYWDPIVLERGGLAIVWTPYSIDENGDRLHCGVDIFSLSNHAGDWKIDSANFTIEPTACDEIKPGARSQVRPDFSVLDAKEN